MESSQPSKSHSFDPSWKVEADLDPQAAAQRARDAVLHRGFDARKKHEAQVKAGTADKSCYDYVRDSVETFKQSVTEQEIAEYTSSIYNCGKVQSFGCFLALHPVTKTVVACSSNTDTFLGRPWKEVLGSSLDSFFKETHKIAQVLELPDLSVANPVILTPQHNASVPILNAIVSMADMRFINSTTGEPENGKGYLFEIEYTGLESSDPHTEGLWQAHQLMRDAVARTQRCDTIEQVLAAAVDEIHKLSGMDRVMVYKFHPDMHGEVIEEFKMPYIEESLLGLHYPATDIPQVNRELFKYNRVRHVKNIHDPGDPILCDTALVKSEDITLIKSVLRQPHACHLEYLANMGVTATMTLAIIVDDVLWGLFACHHHGACMNEPLFVPFQKRTACEFFVQSVSARIKAHKQLTINMSAEHTMNIHIDICEKMMSFPPKERISGLVRPGVNMCACVPHAQGAAVVLPSKIYTTGKVPSEEMIRRILSYVLPKHLNRSKGDSTGSGLQDVVGIECISSKLPNTQSLASLVAGLLSVAIKGTAGGFLVWFRPEFRNTVTYAGVPPSENEIGEMGPRASFAAFDQINHLRCRPWTDDDKRAASALAELVTHVCGASLDPDSQGDAPDITDMLVRLHSERVKTRTQCLTMAADMSRLLDIANAPIFAVDLEGRVHSWNRRCQRLTSLSLEEVRGKGLVSLCPPEYAEVFERSCAEILAGDKHEKFELAMYTEGKADCVQLLINGSVRRDVDGVIEGLVFIGQDITQTLRAIKTAQQVSKDYEVIFANAAIPIFGIDMEGRVNEWNAAMEKSIGLPASQAVGKLLLGDVFGSLLHFQQGNTDKTTELEVLCHQALASSAAIKMDGKGRDDKAGAPGGKSHLELSVLNAEGHPVDLLVSASPRKRHLDQEVMGVLLMAQDITERKTLEMATRVCLAAEAASAARTEQLSFLCHEIRNPLNGVIGYITFLEETRMTEEQEELVKTTQQCCLQLRRIVSDVLDLSSIEQGNMEIEMISFRAVDIINTVMSQVRVVMEDKGLTMQSDIAPNLASIELVGDPSRIMQILSNFAWNACKFTMEGSVTFRVELISTGMTQNTGGKRGLKMILFSVIDTGPGIPKSVLENLFQPFVQGDKSTTRHHGGTGLGLSICRQLAKLMGGDVSCFSTVGHGSTFQLQLHLEVRKMSDVAEEGEGAGFGGAPVRNESDACGVGVGKGSFSRRNRARAQLVSQQCNILSRSKRGSLVNRKAPFDILPEHSISSQSVAPSAFAAGSGTEHQVSRDKLRNKSSEESRDDVDAAPHHQQDNSSRSIAQSVGSSVEGREYKSPEGSYVGSLKASVFKSMELGNRLNLRSHSNSNRSISSLRSSGSESVPGYSSSTPRSATSAAGEQRCAFLSLFLLSLVFAFALALRPSVLPTATVIKHSPAPCTLLPKNVAKNAEHVA